MEAEIVSMVLDLYHGDDDSCGSVTSGGTESILMAVKSARDYYRQKGVTRPEMFFFINLVLFAILLMLHLIKLVITLTSRLFISKWILKLEKLILRTLNHQFLEILFY